MHAYTVGFSHVLIIVQLHYNNTRLHTNIASVSVATLCPQR